ncbi:CmcI family methyltransferase [Methylobacterium sp. NEAU 140]|uniref:cephalosporin hydroxylase family protein n=1 Tax=Methylobacterium sp. NEAU 140 TaxID=3064945 RepID=UPI0027332397|nr:CmcI family methyltransferase [Methylobacterium sp. NEAU 140]MDP4026013.1 CmcI family methyltransferase [Methylobacterium sp. NEAU 140]
MGKDEALFRESTKLLALADKYRYSYLWKWLGVPIIQLPSDVLAMQEVVWDRRPDVIIETGVARGGSIIFFASLLELIGNGRVIGIDIDIRQHNRRSIEDNIFSKRVTLLEGSSIADNLYEQVMNLIPSGSSVMVVLDSDHSYDHVRKELDLYGKLVSPGQYMIVADTMLGRMTADEIPKERSKIWYKGDEPLSALHDYLNEHDDFELDEELNGKMILSSSTGGYLRKKFDGHLVQHSDRG